ncbi:MAG: MurR/RpiR family transcriptional regulator [Bryobacteraceae bacterium]
MSWRKGDSALRSAETDVEPDAKRPLMVYLQGVLASLNPTERLIADYVLSDPERVLSSSIAEIREGSGASVGSIVGFCRRLGLKGFADFKIAVARELAQGGLSAAESARGASVFERVFQCHSQSLMETCQINSEENLKRAAHAIEKARRIQLFSIGISFPVAYTAYCKFHLIGLPAYTEFDSHMQLIAATQLRKGDVSFGISCSGNTRETVQCMEVAQSKGATTICLTNAMKSAITRFAEIALYATPSEIKYFQAPLASRVTQLAVIDALFVYLAQKNKNRTAAQLRQSAEELLKGRLG